MNNSAAKVQLAEGVKAYKPPAQKETRLGNSLTTLWPIKGRATCLCGNYGASSLASC